MKQIPAIDKQIENRMATDSAPVIHGYVNAMDRNLHRLILDDFGLFPSEVPAIIESLRKYDIKQVALINSSSALMGILWEFTQAGATFEMSLIDTGMTETRFNQRLVPGFIITLD